MASETTIQSGTTTQAVVLSIPAPGQTVVVNMQPNQVIEVPFDMAEANVAMAGDDLNIEFAGNAVLILSDFVAMVDQGVSPLLIFADGGVVAGDIVLTALTAELPETAAGPGGANGDNFLIGSDGDDVLAGGADDDLFAYNANVNEGHDTITDFNFADGDVLQIYDVLEGNPLNVDVDVAVTDGDVQLTINSSTQVTIEGLGSDLGWSNSSAHSLGDLIAQNIVDVSQDPPTI
jgi:hypothetical protein